MFGENESKAAQKAIVEFQKNNSKHILELGGGQGRDTCYFAKNHYKVDVLDYSKNALDDLKRKADLEGLTESVYTVQHDIRNPLPFEDHVFDAVYSHMLYCMALTANELEFLSSEIHRVLKPGGINIFTARNTEDPHFGKGIARGEQMFEVGGYIIHFFDKEKVESLSKGFDILEMNKWKEGTLPKNLYYVVQKKLS